MPLIWIRNNFLKLLLKSLLKVVKMEFFFFLQWAVHMPNFTINCKENKKPYLKNSSSIEGATSPGSVIIKFDANLITAGYHP